MDLFEHKEVYTICNEGDIKENILRGIMNVTELDIAYNRLEEAYFKVEPKVNHRMDNHDELVSNMYWVIGDGLIIFHSIFKQASITEGSINDYVDNIIRSVHLNDSAYYTEVNYMDKISRLMHYFSTLESMDNTGYKVLSKDYITTMVSSRVASNFMLQGFKVINYLNMAIPIITGEKQDKTQGQGLVVESFMLWIKIANTLRIDLPTVLKDKV